MSKNKIINVNDALPVKSGEMNMSDEIKKAITAKHKKVSGMETPKHFVKKKMGMDYCEYSYMRDLAEKEYPGWSWEIISEEMLGTEAYKVHGRLTYFDGKWRRGDSVAAHRVQKKRGTGEFVDIGNDVKAANPEQKSGKNRTYYAEIKKLYKQWEEERRINEKNITLCWKWI